MKVLFLTHRLPYAPNRGDRIRANYILRVLSAAAEVQLGSLVHSDDEAAEVRAVAPLVRSVVIGRVPPIHKVLGAARALTGDRPLTHALLDSPELRAALRDLVAHDRPDVVLAFCSGMAPYAMELCDARMPFVLDLVDVDSAKWRALAEATHGWRSAIYRREARVLAAFETTAIRAAAATTVVNARERQALGDAARSVVELPHGMDLDYLRPPVPAAPGRQVVLSGVMSYPPNIDAAEYFATEIWPIVLRREPDANLVIAGADPPRRVTRLQDLDGRVRVTRAVVDIRPNLWQSAVSVAPVRLARGVQTKVLEAIGAGLPVVTTTAVAEGLPPAAMAACAVADEPEPFADAVVRLLQLDPRERRRIAMSADLESFRFQDVLRPLVDLLQGACSPRLRVVKGVAA